MVAEAQFLLLPYYPELQPLLAAAIREVVENVLPRHP